MKNTSTKNSSTALNNGEINAENLKATRNSNNSGNQSGNDPSTVDTGSYGQGNPK